MIDWTEVNWSKPVPPVEKVKFYERGSAEYRQACGELQATLNGEHRTVLAMLTARPWPGDAPASKAVLAELLGLGLIVKVMIKDAGPMPYTALTERGYDVWMA